jgi:hypothetical protein
MRVTIDPASWDIGYQAGVAGDPKSCPEGVDGFSFWSAVIGGKAARQKRDAAARKDVTKSGAQSLKAEP